MSDPSSLQPQNVQGIHFTKALLIVAAVSAFLIILLILRFMCDIAIDVFIMCDADSAWNTITKWKDYLFPCFKRRLINPQDGEGTTQDEAHVTTDAPINLEVMLLGYTAAKRRLILECIMPSKVVTADDLLSWKVHQVESPSLQVGDGSDDHASIDTSGGLCSICLHNIECGDEAVVTKACNHYFHGECILEWVNGNHTECPCCRTELITKADVVEGLRAYRARDYLEHGR